ncbi:MAG: SGNH/GDSL hydrolase family protein [Candidatus Hodarchaeota archaeon]
MDYFIEQLTPFIFGLPWLGKEDCKLQRFPTSALPSLTEAMQMLSRHTAGGVIRFQSRTEVIGLEMNRDPEPLMWGFSSQGQHGIDVYCDGRFYGSLQTDEGYQNKWIQTDDSQVHEYAVYLPTYSPLEIITLSVYGEYESKEGDDVEIEKPRDYKVPGKIVVYGSSITQGAFASRPALAYPARLSRELDAEVVNLGFAGSGKGEHEVSDLLADIQDVSLYILDWGANIAADPADYEKIQERYPYMLEKIKENHPKTPILFINIQAFLQEKNDEFFRKGFKLARETIKDNYEQELSKGTRCEYLEGSDIVGYDEMDLTVDGCHCNDMGFDRYVRAIVPAAKRLLDL